jgi:cytochrome c biogenesis protein CcmG/thiol:disulfide interchange protein DsbE
MPRRPAARRLGYKRCEEESMALAWSALLLGAVLAPADGAYEVEARIIEYLKAEVRPGQRVVVSELVNEVFTSEEERAVLGRLFNTFFKIPLFAAQFQESQGRPPTLDELSEQFGFAVPGEADVLLRIMESDPRMPPFLERDPETGEIVRVDTDAILQHPRFGKLLERSLAGWVGRPAPAVELETWDGSRQSLGQAAGRPHLVYFWFSGCPPCVRTTPILVSLREEYASKGFEVMAVNADRVLELPVTDEDRFAYAEEQGIAFPLLHATPEAIEAYGSVSVFPTLFFVDAGGTVVSHDVNFQERDELEAAVRKTLE